MVKSNIFSCGGNRTVRESLTKDSVEEKKMKEEEIYDKRRVKPPDFEKLGILRKIVGGGVMETLSEGQLLGHGKVLSVTVNNQTLTVKTTEGETFKFTEGKFFFRWFPSCGGKWHYLLTACHKRGWDFGYFQFSANN